MPARERFSELRFDPAGFFQAKPTVGGSIKRGASSTLATSPSNVRQFRGFHIVCCYDSICKSSFNRGAKEGAQKSPKSED
jgi:hypothetical protein